MWVATQYLGDHVVSEDCVAKGCDCAIFGPKKSGRGVSSLPTKFQVCVRETEWLPSSEKQCPKTATMPSASFTSSRSYVRRSRRKGNRIALPGRSRATGKNLLHFVAACTPFVRLASRWYILRRPYNSSRRRIAMCLFFFIQRNRHRGGRGVGQAEYMSV